MTLKTIKIATQLISVISLLWQVSSNAQDYKLNANAMMRVNVSQDTSDEVFPRFWSEGVVFASNRGKGNKVKGDFDLYVMSDTANRHASKLRGKLKSRFNETSPYLSKDANTLYFSRNDLDFNFAKRKRINKLPLKTFVMKKKGNRWTKMRGMPFNSNSYSVAHAVLNGSEDKLYFVSNMPGGYGGMDIYVVNINEDGSYGEPQNLGPTINTEFDETSPFMVGDDQLYFASSGHTTLGGLDVFKTNLNSNSIENLGKEVNTVFDDYGFILDVEKSQAFFSSDRRLKAGRNNIYFIRYNIEKEKERYEEQKEEGVLALTKNTDSLDAVKNSDGTTGGGQIPTSAVTYNLNEEFDKLEKIIYFKFDSEVVQMKYQGPLNEMAAFLRKNDNLQIALVGHTDKIGSFNYNQELSVARANSVKDYLLTQGIKASQITVVGKGESEPAEECDHCPKKEYGRNRRVEIKLNN
jgi:outer membrane protein OmpA-like peptidoglycan-associated protein